MVGKWVGKLKVLGIVLVGLVLILGGCTGGSTPVTVQLSLTTPQNAMAAQVITLTAAVSHDTKAGGVSWVLTGPGTLSNQSTTGVTYTAPSPIASNATATITATSIDVAGKSASVTINLQAVSITLSPSNAQTDEQSQTTSVAATVSNDPQTKGATWSLTGAGALSGQTATAVTYTAPASITTASTATITATSVFDNTKTTTLTVNLVPPPSVTTTSLAAGTVGTAYSATIAATNGATPYSWSVTVGALPAGLTLAAGTGAITGTPTAYGTSNFTVQVKDAGNFTATAALSIKISPAPVVITTSSLPNGVVNLAGYNASLAATGGAAPITWSWVAQTGSSLPPGLSLSGAGVISGTPTTAGTFNVNVTATDASTPALTATKGLSITIIPQLAVTTSSIPNGIATHAYSSTLASTGGFGALTWTLAAGSNLPQGLTLNASTGAISGTPTTSGNYSFTVQAADSGTPQQKVTKTLALTIYGVLSITPTSLPTGAVSSNYNASLFTNGGNPPITWSLASGTMPPGVNLTQAASMGIVSGTPTTAGTYTFTIQATDVGTPTPQTATQQFTVTINPVLAITTTTLASGTVNTAYSQPVLSNNGGIAPLTWSISTGALPPGLNINSSTGVISGTPTTATGSPFNFTVLAVDSGTPQQTKTQPLSIAISTAPLSVATTGLPNGVVGQAYTGAQLQSAGGNPPVTWTWVAQTGSSLPPGLSLNAGSGAITGTPTSAGTFNVSVTATDSTSPTHQTASKSLSITVVSALSITTGSLPGGTVGSNYSTTVNATGGTTPYTWSWFAQTGSSLPPGLSINSSTGVISGTPTTNTGSPFNVTVQVADSETTPQVKTANFSITITVAPLTVTTTSNQLPNGTVNSAYPNNVNLSATGGIPQYFWSLTGGTTLPAGLSLSSNGLISGTPTATGTTNFTVQVADSATPTANTATASLSITVNAAPTCTIGGSESMLNGQYAFVLKGFDNGTGTVGGTETSPEPALVGGVLTFNGSGTITAGAIDMNLDPTQGGVQTNLSVTGNYGVTSDQRGCMVITTSAGTQNYRFSLGNLSGGVASTGHVIDFDSAGPFTAGTMRKQTTTAFGTGTGQITGNYALGVSAPQNTQQCNGTSPNVVCGGKFGGVGVFNFSSGHITGGELDLNTDGFLEGSTTAGGNFPASATVTIANGGSYSVSSTTGRGTLSFTPSVSPTAVTAVIYVVSATDALILSSDNQVTNTLFAGEMLQQSGTLTGTPLSNNTYVGYQSGLESSAGTTPLPSRATLLLLTASTASGGSLSGTQLRNGNGSFSSKLLSGITYSTAPTGTGRMTVNGGSNPPIFYLVSPTQAFSLGGDSNVETGFFQLQTGGPFSSSSTSGTYAFGEIDPEISNTNVSVGLAAFTPATNSINLTQDSNGSGGSQLAQPQTVSYTVDSTGLGMIPTTGSSCTYSATTTTCQTFFYIISPTKAVVLDAQSSNPKVTIVDK